MKALFGSLFICVGVYFSVFPGAELIRSIGYSKPAAALDGLGVCSPFVSITVLLLVGFIVTMKGGNDREAYGLMVKLPLVCLVALIPVAVHIAMMSLTFAVDPPPPRLFGPISVSMWIALVLGCCLITLGVCFLVRTRNSTHPNENHKHRPAVPPKGEKECKRHA
jgi:hypothetical protein